MSLQQFTCPCCSGSKKIEIGRNIDNKSEKLEPCPGCNGKGYLNVNLRTYDKDFEKVMKRLFGDSYGKYW